MSYTNLNYHIVFSTKARKPFLSDEQVQGVIKYISGVLSNRKGCLFLGNGVADHIHLMCSLHPESCISEIARSIKANSSRWIHETYSQLQDFDWQDGYSAFSVSYSGVDRVTQYIRGQQEHHKKMTFEEELLLLLKKHKIPFKPEYVFG